MLLGTCSAIAEVSVLTKDDAWPPSLISDIWLLCHDANRPFERAARSMVMMPIQTSEIDALAKLRERCRNT